MNVKLAVLLRAATVPTEVGLAKEAALGQPGPPPITSRGALAEMKSDDNKNPFRPAVGLFSSNLRTHGCGGP